MGEYLERYLSGECQPVWDELVGLGAAVREEPIYSDALAVARETMRRARANIETLIPRIVMIGYRFGYGWVQPYWRQRMLHPYKVNYDPATGRPYFATPTLLLPEVRESYTFADRSRYEEYLEQARGMPALFTPATDREEQIAALDQQIARVPQAQTHDGVRARLRELKAEQEARPTASDTVAEYEAVLGTLPLSVRVWYEAVGGVNFAGNHDGWRALLPESAQDYPTHAGERLYPMRAVDPLFVLPLNMEWLAYMRNRKPGERASLTLTTEDTYKYLEPSNDPFYVLLPNAHADAMIHYRGKPWKTFVFYLRECFQWGGFPGWARLERRPEVDLAFLTQGLLPI